MEGKGRQTRYILLKDNLVLCQKIKNGITSRSHLGVRWRSERGGFGKGAHVRRLTRTHLTKGWPTQMKQGHIVSQAGEWRDKHNGFRNSMYVKFLFLYFRIRLILIKCFPYSTNCVLFSLKKSHHFRVWQTSATAVSTWNIHGGERPDLIFISMNYILNACYKISF